MSWSQETPTASGSNPGLPWARAPGLWRALAVAGHGLLVFGLAAGALGCPDPTDGDRDPAGTITVDAGPPEPPKPPPLPFATDDDRLDVVAAWAVTPATEGKPEELRPLDRTARPWAVPMDSALRVELWQRLSDFRVRLIDGKGHPVASEALVGQIPTRQRGGEVEPGGTWIQMDPRGSFPPSTPIRVFIDGENGPYVVDIHGQAFQDLHLDVVGDSPPAVLEDPTDGGHRPIGAEELP